MLQLQLSDKQFRFIVDIWWYSNSALNFGELVSRYDGQLLRWWKPYDDVDMD